MSYEKGLVRKWYVPATLTRRTFPPDPACPTGCGPGVVLIWSARCAPKRRSTLPGPRSGRWRYGENRRTKGHA